MSMTIMLALYNSKTYTHYVTVGTTSIHSSFFQVCLDSKSCPSLLKAVGLSGPAWYSREFSLSAQVKAAPLRGLLQLIILFAEKLTYLDPKLFLIIIYSCPFFLLNYQLTEY
jgi:hypothetical protein